MENKTIYLGSHVDMKAPDYYLASVKDALSYGSTAFMFYTGAPQNSYRKPLEELKIEEGRALLKEAGFDESKIIVHAPYLINGANKVNPDTQDIARKLIASELVRTAGFGCSVLVLHPGAHVGLGSEEGIKTLVECLDYVLSNDNTNVKIAIETMAGKGSEIGVNFEEINQIINSSKYSSRLGVCLDTCHISDAGYDVHDVDGVLKEFDRIIGLDKLLVVHLNDSKNPQGAHKDRHENVGYGYIGFETLCKYANHPLLQDIPKILETPWVDDKRPYKEEIKMLREQKYIDGWREKL